MAFLCINWITWPQHALTAGMVYCLFQLTAVNLRYRKAAIFLAVQLVCVLVNAAISYYCTYLLLHTNTNINEGSALQITAQIMLALAMAANWIATYQLYNAHGDIAAGNAPTLARQWRQLFFWTLGVAVCRFVASWLLAQLLLGGILVTNAYNLMYTLLISIPPVVLCAAPLLYLCRTIRVLEKE